MSSETVAYITFREKPWSNLLRRQVVDVISEINELTSQQIILISFLPFYEYIRNNDEINNLRYNLEEENIQFVTIPVPFPVPIYSPTKGWTNYWKYGWLRMILVLIYTLPFLLYFRLIKGISTYHCRSYPISTCVMVMKRITKNTRFIFDPRSDFPEEKVTRGHWSENSVNFKMWKKLERHLCVYSDYTIAISTTYDDHYKNIYENTQTTIIPNNVDTEEFSPQSTDEQSFRRKHGIKRSTVLVCYLGSMSANSWNNPNEYACTMEKLLYTDIDFKFMFLVPPRANKLLRRTTQDYDVRDSDYIIKNPEFNQVSELLSYSDLGIYILDNRSIRIGTKFVEYCSVGVPTLVNQNIEGAAELIEKHNLGTVINLPFNSGGKYCPPAPLSEDDISRITNLLSNKERIAENCRRFAKEEFDTVVIAKKYRDIYQKI